jgi:hypothetical protein
LIPEICAIRYGPDKEEFPTPSDGIHLRPILADVRRNWGKKPSN